jgi:hypothetical protein
VASWLSAVGLHPLSEGSILIGIFTWQHSFAGEDTRPEAHVVTFQSIAALSIGGRILRSIQRYLEFQYS